MARGPYQGTFNPNVRPTVVTAPDAIVYINGQQEVIGCPKCTRSFQLNKYITSVQTDLSVDSVPGTATIAMSIPRHTIDDFYFDGNAIITPMMEIEIYAKGYYLVEGLPQYYPIFWGLVTEVSDSYSGGEHSVSINCSDILKWWELCLMGVNPAWKAPAGQQGRNTLTANVYAGTNPYDIIFSLALKSFGDVVVAQGSWNQEVREASQRSTFKFANDDMMLYWSKRFARMRSNLVLYGTSGAAVRGDTIYQKYKLSGNKKYAWASTAIRDANGGVDGGEIGYDPAGDNVAAMKQVSSNAGQVDVWQSEYITKLQLANTAKDTVGFEFYMDVTGDIVFKPPFYNLDVLGNKPLSWIQDIDIIDWDFSESESEVITQITMQGSLHGTSDYGTGAEQTPYTSVTDYHLLSKYGWRLQDYTSDFIAAPDLLFLHGLDVLDRINSKRHRGTVTIPMRPELRMGFPIYIAPKDQVWYVSGISHNVSFGSRATSTLTLTAKRSKFIAPRGIGNLQLTTFKKDTVVQPKDGERQTVRYTARDLSNNGIFKLDVTNTATIPAEKDAYETVAGADNPYEPLVLRHPKTGRIVGYPNVVMAYTRPFAPGDVTKQAGQISGVNRNLSQAVQAKQAKNLELNNATSLDGLQATVEDSIIDKHLTNRYQYGLNSAGVFVYAHDSTKVITSMITLPVKNLKVTPTVDGGNIVQQTALIRPVSDERGFEVIGHSQYGRRLSLKDGRLIVNTSADGNERAQVTIQLALSGGLSETLSAQSQGLTTLSSSYADPATTLSTLTPEDRQSAAIIHPDTKTPEFVDIGDNLLGSPGILGSAAQKGTFPTIEASQLSRALTLTEMSVIDSETRNDEDCVCLTGRQDLAFITSGYQVQTLTGPAAASDRSELTSSLDALGFTGGPITGGAIETAQADADLLFAQLEEAYVDFSKLEAEVAALSVEDAGTPVWLARTQAVIDQQNVIRSLEQQGEAARESIEVMQMEYNSGSAGKTPASNKSRQELISKVDQFLVNLYQTLDTPHQELERALRGELLPGQPRDTSGLNADKINPPSEFAPPFSAANRFMLGDPKAAIGAVQTNVSNLSKAWSNFGKDLKSNAKKTKLSKEISNDRASIARLTATRERLVQQQKSSATVIGIDLQDAIDSIDKQIAKLEREISDNQLKLNAL